MTNRTTYRKLVALAARGGLAVALWLLVLTPQPVAAQQQFVTCAPFGTQPLIKIPEIVRDAASRTLRGVMITSDQQRNLWFAGGATGTFCAPQYMRYYWGYRAGQPGDWNVAAYTVSKLPEPLPGPTLRARVGDLIQLTFLNQIDTKHFGASIDRGERGEGCDTSTSGGATGQIYPGSDTMPNCIHGSSTSNLHFHGTHTTPSTTGDNVLVQVRPSLRIYPPEPDGRLVVTESVVRAPFADFFQWCAANGSPTRWDQLPRLFREQQMGRSATQPGGWIGQYDRTDAYQKVPLWSANQQAIAQNGWPMYFIGAFPYCFRLPEFDPSKVKMGQAPGTHWYHAHKHGSTDINVSNGMAGAFVVEGAYDDTLRAFYRSTPTQQNWDLQEHVMVLQQLGTVPNLLSSNATGPSPLSVNGRQQPVVTMRPGQVQLWRIVNGSARNMVTFCPVVAPAGSAGIIWRQTAQDGVQFKPVNYDNVGRQNATISMAAGNRIDLLVQAPTAAGSYQVNVATGVRPGTCPAKTTLLNIVVDATLPAAQPQMPFIDSKSFPVFPDFLNDIPDGDIKVRRELVFNTSPNGPAPAARTAPPVNSHSIDHKQFTDEKIDQVMLLDSVEEWRLLNTTVASGSIQHPFHIHVNPFQVTEVYDPAAAANKACLNPADPSTWKPCTPGSPKDAVWWDVFAIPAGVSATLSCTTQAQCPEAVRAIAVCPGGTSACTVTVPGYFKMRTRFADYAGAFVLHCHILAHEDRGMMQLVQVVPNRTVYAHH